MKVFIPTILHIKLALSLFPAVFTNKSFEINNKTTCKKHVWQCLKQTKCELLCMQNDILLEILASNEKTLIIFLLLKNSLVSFKKQSMSCFKIFSWSISV